MCALALWRPNSERSTAGLSIPQLHETVSSVQLLLLSQHLNLQSGRFVADRSHDSKLLDLWNHRPRLIDHQVRADCLCRLTISRSIAIQHPENEPTASATNARLVQSTISTIHWTTETTIPQQHTRIQPIFTRRSRIATVPNSGCGRRFDRHEFALLRQSLTCPTTIEQQQQRQPNDNARTSLL